MREKRNDRRALVIRRLLIPFSEASLPYAQAESVHGRQEDPAMEKTKDFSTRFDDSRDLRAEERPSRNIIWERAKDRRLALPVIDS